MIKDLKGLNYTLFSIDNKVKKIANGISIVLYI